MKLPQKYKNRISSKAFFSFIICLMIYGESVVLPQYCLVYGKTTAKLKTKRHAHIVRHKRITQDDSAAREAAAREAQEAKLNEGKNMVLAKAYRLYDSGTSENLQGNYKYSVLQLKLADELLQEHGQANTSLAMATLMGLASSAQAAHDYPLAKTTYERLLLSRPQDIQILLKLAKVEMAKGNFRTAQTEINKVLDIAPNDAEARLMGEVVLNRLKAVKRL